MVIRVDHIPENLAAEAAQPPSVAPANRVATGTLRYTGSGEVETVGVARYQAGQDESAGSSIAATMNSTYGKPTVELVPGDPSSRTLVESAARMGLVRRDGDRWVDVTAADGKPVALAEPQQALLEQEVDPGAEVFDPRVDELFDQSIADMDQGAVDASMASVIGVVALGNGSLEDSARTLASRANMDPARAQMMIENGTFVFQAAADNAMRKLGIEGDQLERMYEAFRAQPRQLMPAVQRLALSRDPSGLVEMARIWQAGNP